MADARRSGRAPPRSSSPPLVDEDGFRRVVSRRRLREDAHRVRPPPPPRVRRPVPADLVGRCFNCLAFDHVASQCVNPSRCLRCEKIGHVAKNCKRPRCAPLRGRGRPVRRANPHVDAAVASNYRGVDRSAAFASTASLGSASTGRDYSGPPSICAALPTERSTSPASRRLSPAGRSEGRSSPPPFPPELPPGHPTRRIPLVTRTVARTEELQLEEDAMVATALVVLVLGTRPSLAPYQVRRFIQENYGMVGSDFTLLRYWPEDFLVIFRNPADLQRVLDAPPLPRADMILRFRRWNRLATADGETMRYRVMLEIRGLPAHAWSAATAQVILGDSCATPELTPITVARADLRRFQTVVWCSDPDLIPNEAVIRIPEKVDVSGDNNLFLRPKETIHHDLRLLRYRVEIEILEIHDWNDSGSSDDGGTLPDRVISDSDSDEDYQGLTQHLLPRLWPRRTVFRTPGYGDGAGDTSGGGGGASFGGAADGGNSAPMDRESRGWSFPCSIRFGSFGCVDVSPGRCMRAEPIMRPNCSVLDEAVVQLALERDVAVTGRAFDPMLFETAVQAHFDLARVAAASVRAFDPMIAEADGAGRVRTWVHDDAGMLGPVQLDKRTSHLLSDPMLAEFNLQPPPSEPAMDEVVAVPAADNDISALVDLESVHSVADLVAVRFDVQDPQPLSHVSDDMHNVTVARGARETLPLHLFAGAEIPTNDVIADFARAVCTDAPPPPLVASPPRRRSRPQPEEFTIRRSERLARKSRYRATKPVVQAQNIMMKKLGITSDSQPPDASSFQQFTATFSSTLTTSHCEALDALLPAGMGSLATEVASPMMVS